MVAGRVIRVFVSSTFRDMQDEREELVKRVFPELRHLCESRGVTWGEVDLRWGVTDEEKSEGAVLPICLAEIERSRPYFIGLLGERYGWVPDEIPADLAEREGWLAEHADRSVTELEILHGVLNDPEMAGHAFFYFRDPSWTGDKRDFVDEDATLIAKLAALKARIRASGFPLVDPYADPVALGADVRRDLVALVDRLFPEASPPDALARARAEQDAYAQSRFSGYVVRAALESRLDEWRAAPSAPPLVVTGEPGSGKSALLASWAARQTGPVVVHFVGASPESSDWAAAVRRLYGELGRLSGLSDDEPPTDAEELRIAFGARLLGAPDGTLLVVDGLDQLVDRDGARELSWLPEHLPPGVRLAVSTLPGVPLDEARRRGFDEMAVGLLTDEERREMVVTFLGRYSKRISTAQTDRLVHAPQCGNPLFLRAALDELRQWGDHFTLDERIDHYLAARTIDDLYELILERWETDFERDRPGLVRDLFCALWAARFGLSEAEIGDRLAAPRAVWAPLSLAAEQSLVSRDGLLGFFHAALRRAVEDRYQPGAADHRVLAAYFDAQPSGPRAAAERVWQHEEAEDWDGARVALADPAWLRVAYVRDFFDVRSLWLRVAAEQPRAALDAYAPVSAAPDADVDTSWAVGRLLADLGHQAEAATIQRALVAHYRASGNDARLAASLVNLAAAVRQTGDMAGARASLEEAADAAERADKPAVAAAALQNLGGILRDTGHADEALAVFAREEALARGAGLLADVGAAIGMRGAVLDDRGDTDGALACHEEQERICRQAADFVGVGRSLGAQAKVWSDRGDTARGLDLYGRQEAIARRLGDLTMLLYCRANQAAVLIEQGNPAAADQPLVEADALVARLADATGAVHVVKLRALAARQRGDLDAAVALATDLRARCAALGDAGGEADALQLHASVLLLRGEPAAALDASREQESLARAHGLGTPLETAIGDQGLAKQQLGDLDGALAAYEEQERLARASGRIHGVQAALGNQATIHAARGDGAGALSLLAQQTELCRTAGLRNEVRVALANRVQIHLAMGDLPSALTVLALTEEIGRDLGDDALVRQSTLQRGSLLVSAGQPAAALPLLAEAERLARAADDRATLAGALLDEGIALVATGALDRAWVVMQEQEPLSRALGDWHGLQGVLGNQAIVLQQRGDIVGALAKTAEQEAICRQTGDQGALVMAIANRGELTAALPGRQAEGIAALQEAYALAQQLGLGPLAQQIAALVQQISSRPAT